MSPTPPFLRINGTRDLLGRDYALAQHLRLGLQALLEAYGYQPVETPILEQTDLYLRKSGGEVAARMYALTDQGGRRLSLRPEFTASVIRSYLERADALSLPVRWQYCGPVFRSEAPYRQQTQLGAELIGSASRRADAEVVALACRGLEALGLHAWELVLSSAGLLPALLEDLGLSERATLLIVRHLEALRRGPEGLASVRERLAEFGLLGLEPSEVPGYLSGMDEQDARAIIRGLLSSGGVQGNGGRDADEILQRFLAKLRRADDPERVEQALALAVDLAQVRAAPDEALAAGEDIALRFGLSPRPLDDLRRLLALLERLDLDPKRITVDLGLARGLAYYTGVIFDLIHPDLPPDRPLGGGGRYDGLVRSLGDHTDVPAIGFAYTLEHLEEALTAEDIDLPLVGPPLVDALLVPESERAYRATTTAANLLRAAGMRATVEIEDRSLAESIRSAEQRGIGWVLLISEAGVVVEEYRTGLGAGVLRGPTPGGVLRDAAPGPS
ncbi:MAG: ATP phosphoribosyltransferase regulatory subunit [Chloroflexi bacterium]|nr:ATP phosphoribosyltransferase regulatory subunit [Chloroflexota bacterium]